MAARINPSGGVKPDKIWSDAIRRAVHREAEKGKPTKRIEVLAEQLVKEAMQGDIQALKEIGDRLDGKPVQQNTVTGDPTAPVQILVNTGVRRSTD